MPDQSAPEAPPPSHVHVSARAVAAQLNAFERLGLDPHALLEEVGLEPDEIADPDERLPYEKVLLLWVNAMRVSGDEYLGLHASQKVELSDYEIFGYLARTCPTVAELFAALHRYQRLLADAIEIEASLEGERIHLQYRAPERHELPRPIAEYVMGSLAKLGKETIGPECNIVEVRFHHEAPPGSEVCETVLMSKVRFDCGENALLVEAPLAASLPSSDTELHGILRRQADRLVKEHGSDPFVKQVSEVVERALLGAGAEAGEDGPASLEIERVAAQVDVSPRALKRRLAERGTSLSEITDSLRRELAMHHLASTELSVGEIGFLVGFSEPSAFHRAFRRWTNQTPSHFRASR